jgi:hypothetical protein
LGVIRATRRQDDFDTIPRDRVGVAEFVDRPGMVDNGTKRPRFVSSFILVASSEDLVPAKPLFRIVR